MAEHGFTSFATFMIPLDITLEKLSPIAPNFSEKDGDVESLIRLVILMISPFPCQQQQLRSRLLLCYVSGKPSH